MKKITLSIAAAAAFAVSVAGAVAAELPSYERAGLPISPVQMQVLGAQHVEQVSPVAASASPVQLSVLKPRGKMKTAQGHGETIGRAAQ